VDEIEVNSVWAPKCDCSDTVEFCGHNYDIVVQEVELFGTLITFGYRDCKGGPHTVRRKNFLEVYEQV